MSHSGAISGLSRMGRVGLEISAQCFTKRTYGANRRTYSAERLFCKYWIYSVSTIDLLGPGQH